MPAAGCFALLLLSSLAASGQGPLTYSVWFRLLDKQGQELKANSYRRRHISCYVRDFDGSRLRYDRRKRLFHFSETSNLAGTLLVLITPTDTTVMHVRVPSLYLPDARLLPGTYLFGRPVNGAHLESSAELMPELGKIWYTPAGFASYRLNPAGRIEWNHLVKIKIQ